MREVGSEFPVDCVGGGVDAQDELLGMRYYHDPVIFIPYYLGITERWTTNRQDGVVGIVGEGPAVIGAVRDSLRLLRSSLSVNSYHTIRLIREEARRVVHVDHS